MGYKLKDATLTNAVEVKVHYDGANLWFSGGSDDAMIGYIDWVAPAAPASSRTAAEHAPVLSQDVVLEAPARTATP